MLADDVVVAIEMHLDLGAVLTLDLVDAAGALPIVSIVSLHLGEGSAAHRSERGALRLLGVEAGEPLLGVSTAILRSEIVPTWVIVEASCAYAIVPSKVIRARVVVLGEGCRREDQRGQIKGSRALVRYADDWVMFCESEQDAQAARLQTQQWLLKRGLHLSAEKTRIVHLSEGFDFLGFNVRHYPAPKTARSGYKLLIKPSKESVSKFKERMRLEWTALNGHNAMEVLKRLNPIVRGWANYFHVGVSKHTFETLDHWMFVRSARHVRSNHSRKGWRWCRSKYWGQLNPERADRWVIGDKSTGAYLLKLSWMPIRRHVLVKGAASPDDPDLRGYWIERERRKLEEGLLPPRLMGLARAQRGLCTHCGASLFNGEALNRHHLLPKSEGGTDERSNLRLLHLYCHQQIHAAASAREPSDAKATRLSRVRGNPHARF